MHALSRQRRAVARAAAALAVALAVVDNTAIATPPGEASATWRGEVSFTVRLDGKPIGTHRFVFANAGDGGLALKSEAQFDITLLGVSFYRYRHRVAERWADGCLAAIEARTEDNGRQTEVQGRTLNGRFDLHVRYDGRAEPASAVAVDCLMSFAYWNPALAEQKRLLDPGSGRIEAVTMTPITSAPADFDAQAQTARGLRIGGLAEAIDVWYAGNRWVGLDTIVGGRRLSYRLR